MIFLIWIKNVITIGDIRSFGSFIYELRVCVIPLFLFAYIISLRKRPFFFFSLTHLYKMPATTTVQPSTVAHIHPLVLLSATDHYNRVAKDTKKRVVGVLLGQNKGKTVNISNSFAGTKQ
jgi:hypothetical protein